MKRWTTEILSLLAIALLVGTVWAQPPGGRQGPPGGRVGGPGRGGPQADFRPPMYPLLMALDANRDGEISAEEIQNATAALKKLDKNGDGKLTRDELRPVGPARHGGPGMGGPRQGGPGGPGRGGPGGVDGGPAGGGFAERLMSLDANKDGKVDKDELPERMQRVLERGDLNKDGAIDKEEIAKLAEQFGQTGGRGGQAGGGRGGRGAAEGGGRPAGKVRPQRPE